MYKKRKENFRAALWFLPNIIYLSRAVVRGIFVFPRESAHYNPRPPDLKLRGSTRLNVKKCLKSIDKCWGGGVIMDVPHKLWQRVGA